MKKEKLINDVTAAIKGVLEEYYDDIVVDMNRAREDILDSTKAFKFPLSLTVVLKPSSAGTKFNLGIKWNNPKSYSTGDYIVDDGDQIGLFDVHEKDGGDEDKVFAPHIARESDSPEVGPLESPDMPEESTPPDFIPEQSFFPFEPQGDPGFQDPEIKERYERFIKPQRKVGE